jgi:hypothetical protein
MIQTRSASPCHWTNPAGRTTHTPETETGHLFGFKGIFPFTSGARPPVMFFSMFFGIFYLFWHLLKKLQEKNQLFAMVNAIACTM